MSARNALKYITGLGLRTKKEKKLSYSTFYRMLGDPFYYGEFEFPLSSGTWYSGKHPKMLDQDIFDQVQIVMGRKNAPRPKKHNFPYTGLMVCGECGCSITAEEKTKIQKNRNIHYYSYYRCTKKKGTCSQKPIEISNLENQFIGELKNIRIPEEFAQWAINELKKD
jgi:hypothetical protein